MTYSLHYKNDCSSYLIASLHCFTGPRRITTSFRATSAARNSPDCRLVTSISTMRDGFPDVVVFVQSDLASSDHASMLLSLISKYASGPFGGWFGATRHTLVMGQFT